MRVGQLLLRGSNGRIKNSTFSFAWNKKYRVVEKKGIMVRLDTIKGDYRKLFGGNVKCPDEQKTAEAK